MKILIGAIGHESNTFTPLPTTMKDFDVRYGSEVIEHLTDLSSLAEDGPHRNLESQRVRHQPGLEIRGHLRRDRNPGLHQNAPQQLGGGRGTGVNQVDLPVALVGDVMIDVDHDAGGQQSSRRGGVQAQELGRGRIHREDHVDLAFTGPAGHQIRSEGHQTRQAG